MRRMLRAGLATACAAALVATPAATAAKTPSCALVTATMLKSALGATFAKPTSTSNAPVLVCNFRGLDKIPSLLVRFQVNESASSFRLARKQFDAHGERTKTVTGIGQAAYSSTLGSGAFATNTLVVLKGSTELLVTAPAPLARVEALARKLLPAL